MWAASLMGWVITGCKPGWKARAIISARIMPAWISNYCLSWKSQLGTSCGIKAHNFLFLRPWKVFAHSLVVIDVTGYQVSTNYKLMMSYCKFTCYCFFFNHKNIISILRNLLVESITASGLLLDPRRLLLMFEKDKTRKVIRIPSQHKLIMS